MTLTLLHKNSSGNEIANVNFFYDDIVHVEASAFAHLTDCLISTISMLGLMCAHNKWSMYLRPSNPVISLFCPNNRWVIAQIVLYIQLYSPYRQPHTIYSKQYDEKVNNSVTISTHSSWSHDASGINIRHLSKQPIETVSRYRIFLYKILPSFISNIFNRLTVK